MRIVCFAVCAAVLCCLCTTHAHADFIEDFESYVAPIPYGKVLLRCPGYSASTSSKLAFYYASVVSVDPTDPENNMCVLGWQWKDDPQIGNWLRLTTHNAERRGCPALGLDGAFSFRVLYFRQDDSAPTDPLGIAVALRETGTSAPDGAFGGTSGPIEWLGATGGSATTGPTGVTHYITSSPEWQRLTFYFRMEPVSAFTGNGVLDGARGVFEGLALTRTGAPGPYLLFFDDFRYTMVPEPCALAILGAGLAVIARFRRSAAGRAA